MDARRSRSRTPAERRRDNATAAVTNLAFQKKGAGHANNVKQRKPQAAVKREKEAEPGIPRPLLVSKPVALSLVDLSFMLSLVFGGCCTYVT